MAQLVIIINNASAADVRDTLCNAWGYSGDLQDAAAKMEFVRSYIAIWLKDRYRAHKATLDAETARIASSVATQNVDIT